MLNPLRSEQEAFRFLIYVVVVVAVIVGRRRCSPARSSERPTWRWPSAPRGAGALLMERFGGPARGVDAKSSATDMVSDADREAEE